MEPVEGADGESFLAGTLETSTGAVVPLSLKRELAEDAHAAWMLSGSVGRNGDNYVVTVRLNSAGDGKQRVLQCWKNGDALGMIVYGDDGNGGLGRLAGNDNMGEG